MFPSSVYLNNIWLVVNEIKINQRRTWWRRLAWLILVLRCVRRLVFHQWFTIKTNQVTFGRNRQAMESWMILFFVPGGYISTLETKQRECWKFWDSRCEFRVWFASQCATFQHLSVRSHTNQNFQHSTGDSIKLLPSPTNFFLGSSTHHPKLLRTNRRLKLLDDERSCLRRQWATWPSVR